MTVASFHIRRFQPTDAPSLYGAVTASLPELAHWMPWCTLDYALAQAQSWVRYTETAWANQTEYPMAIVHGESDAVVGGVGINQLNRAHRIGNIGYWVSTPYTGRGVARAAARQIAAFGFGELGLSRLEIVTLPHNQASQKVAYALGATREGIARNRLWIHGVAQDAVVYALIPRDLGLG